MTIPESHNPFIFHTVPSSNSNIETQNISSEATTSIKKFFRDNPEFKKASIDEVEITESEKKIDGKPQFFKVSIKLSSLTVNENGVKTETKKSITLTTKPKDIQKMSNEQLTSFKDDIKTSLLNKTFQSNLIPTEKKLRIALGSDIREGLQGVITAVKEIWADFQAAFNRLKNDLIVKIKEFREQNNRSEGASIQPNDEIAPAKVIDTRTPQEKAIVSNAIVSKCIKLLDGKKPFSEGIFRLSTVKSDLEEIEEHSSQVRTSALSDEILKKLETPIEGQAHDIFLASVIKNELKNLSFPKDIANGLRSMGSQSQISIKEIKDLINQLPEENKATLKSLKELLDSVNSQESTKMPYNNLATMIGPNLFFDSEIDRFEELKNTGPQNNIMKIILENELFSFNDQVPTQ